jgi:hypothetical protein
MKSKCLLFFLAVMSFFITNAFAQSITRIDFTNSICLSSGPCVEAVNANPGIVLVYYLKSYQTVVLDKQLVWNVTGLPCLSTPESPIDDGPMWVNGKFYTHVWYIGDEQTVKINDLVRVIGVPSTFKGVTGKIYQVTKGGSIAFVFNKGGKLLSWMRNPLPNRVWPKNTFVTICNSI